MKNLSKAAVAILIIQLLSKPLGFLQEMCLAYKFGTSYIVDAYTVCITLPNVLFSIFAGGFSESYIAAYMRVEGDLRRREFFNNVTTILFVLAVILSGICFICSDWLTAILVPGFPPSAAQLLSNQIRIISWILPAQLLFTMLAAHMQAHEDFIVVNFCNMIVTHILIIVSILISSENTPGILAAGYIVPYVVNTVILWIRASRKKQITYHPRLDLQDPMFRSLYMLAIPLGASRLVNQLNGVADRMFASLLGEGVTSALNYANKVQLIFYTLSTAVFLSVCYPRINRFFAEGSKDGGLYYIKKAVMLSAYVSLPVAGGLFLFSSPLIALLFERGVFSAESTAMTAGCLAFYALGVPFYALREIGSQGLAANMEQKLIFKNTSLSVLFNIGLNLLLIRPLGYIGLALATSLAGLLSALLMLWDLKKEGLQVLDGSMAADMKKISVSTALSLGVGFVCFQLWKGTLGESPTIIIAAAIAGITYVIGSILLRIDVFFWFYRRLPAKLQILPGCGH